MIYEAFKSTLRAEISNEAYYRYDDLYFHRRDSIELHKDRMPDNGWERRLNTIRYFYLRKPATPPSQWKARPYTLMTSLFFDLQRARRPNKVRTGAWREHIDEECNECGIIF